MKKQVRGPLKILPMQIELFDLRVTLGYNDLKLRPYR